MGAVLAFGTSRYRAPAEPCLVVLAAVGVDAVVRRYEWRRRPAGGGGRLRARPHSPADRVAADGRGDEPTRVTSLVGAGLRGPNAKVGLHGPGSTGGDMDGFRFDERRALWTDGRGRWTDGHGHWTDGQDVWIDDGPIAPPVGWAIPDPDENGDGGWDGDDWGDDRGDDLDDDGHRPAADSTPDRCGCPWSSAWSSPP